MEQDISFTTAVVCLLVLYLLGMMGCAGDPPRQYNREEPQDQECLQHYGGAKGYCGMFLYPRGK